jgi:hypothetical protein
VKIVIKKGAQPIVQVTDSVILEDRVIAITDTLVYHVHIDYVLNLVIIGELARMEFANA